MEVYRKPDSGNQSTWNKTDAKKPNEYIKDWKPGKMIEFDGTIDKSGERHTDFGLKLTESDVEHLTRSLIKHYKETINEKDNEISKLREICFSHLKEVNELREVFRKIHDIIGSHADKAPSKKGLLKAISEIADYYRWTYHLEKDPLKFDWLDWESV